MAHDTVTIGVDPLFFLGACRLGALAVHDDDRLGEDLLTGADRHGRGVALVGFRRGRRLDRTRSDEDLLGTDAVDDVDVVPVVHVARLGCHEDGVQDVDAAPRVVQLDRDDLRAARPGDAGARVLDTSGRRCWAGRRGRCRDRDQADEHAGQGQQARSEGPTPRSGHRILEIVDCTHVITPLVPFGRGAPDRVRQPSLNRTLGERS